MPATASHTALSLLEALVATAGTRLWARYCRLAIVFEGGCAASLPVYAIGSVEGGQQQASSLENDTLSAAQQQAGHRRLARYRAAPGFSGMPSPFGARSAEDFAEFVAGSRGPAPLLAEIADVERQLVEAFEDAGRTRHYQAFGFGNGRRKAIEPEWFGRVYLDFANNQVALPDASIIAGIEVTLDPNASAPGEERERPARAMLREALVSLWARGDFTAGTGNERVLALVLKELGLPASNPPYGFKSAETIRKLRKTLKMSL